MRKSASVGDWMVDYKQMVCTFVICSKPNFVQNHFCEYLDSLVGYRVSRIFHLLLYLIYNACLSCIACISLQPIGQSSNDSANINIPASLLVPHLHNLFQQTSIQQVREALSLSNVI